MIDQIYGFGNGLINAGWWTSAGWPTTWALIKIVVLVAPLMGAVAYLTLWERKAIGFTQIRIGPNRIGPSGLLQPIADALKLMMKGAGFGHVDIHNLAAGAVALHVGVKC